MLDPKIETAGFPNLGNPPPPATIELHGTAPAAPTQSQAAGPSRPEPARRASPPRLEPKMLNVNQVADLLTCSPRTVYRQVDMGCMPKPIRIGRLVRWPAGAIDEWISQGCPDQRQRQTSLPRRQSGGGR